MKKKIYQQPEMKVVEIDLADIICESNNGARTESLTEDDFSFS